MLSNNQYRLFKDTGIPDWLPGETLYSLASRYHKISGSPSPQVTSIRLFGGQRQGYQHDFPSGLEHFVHVAESKRGTVEDLAYTHTLLPLFLIFRDQDTANDALATMASPQIGSLKYRLGLLTTGLGASYPLKACPECMQMDSEKYSVAYWHLHHQLPGVWFCPHHKVPLLSSHLKTIGPSRFEWLLPDTAQLKQWVIGKRILKKLTPVLIDLAHVVIRLASKPPNTYISQESLLASYLASLENKSLLTRSRRLKAKDIGESYFEYFRYLGFTPLAQAIPETPEKAAAQVCRLFRIPRTGTHPLRHAMLITWLFGQFEQFWDSLQIVSTLQSSKVVSSKNHTAPIDSSTIKQEEFLNLVTIQKYSVSKASIAVGIDIATGIGWASANGISTTLRPKKLKADFKEKIIELVLKGVDRSVIAKKCDLSTSTVSRLIRSEVGLEQKWIDIRFDKRRAKERNTWEKLIKEIGFLGVKAIRAQVPATFAWLHRNDRAWLMNTNSAIPRVSPSKSIRINWDKRDEKLALEVRKTALILAEENGYQPISRTKIYQALPKLRAVLKRLNELPLTKKALDAITGNRNYR